MAKIVTLKNPDGETIYPVTLADAVVTDPDIGVTLVVYANTIIETANATFTIYSDAELTTQMPVSQIVSALTQNRRVVLCYVTSTKTYAWEVTNFYKTSTAIYLKYLSTATGSTNIYSAYSYSLTSSTMTVQNTPIQSASIANSAVTTGKIGWSSMPYVNYTNSNSVSSLSTSWTNLYSFSVADFPTGAVIAITATVQLSVSSTQNLFARVAYAEYHGMHSVAQQVIWGHHLPIVDCITKTAGYNTAYIQGMVTGSSNGAWGCRVVAHRIA